MFSNTVSTLNLLSLLIPVWVSTKSLLCEIVLLQPSLKISVGSIGQDNDAQHCGASGSADPQKLQPTPSTADRQKLRLLVIRTHRCSSTAFGGWILRAVQASHGRLEAYRAQDGEVARTGVTAWAAHANSVLHHRTIGPLPDRGVVFPPFPSREVLVRHAPSLFAPS